MRNLKTGHQVKIETKSHLPFIDDSGHSLVVAKEKKQVAIDNQYIYDTYDRTIGTLSLN